MAFCQKCGENNIDDASFCIKCGNKLTSGAPTIKTSSTPVQKDISQAITDFIRNYSGKKSKNIFTGDDLNSAIGKHKSKHLTLDTDEKPLVLLNKGAIMGNVFSGLAITNKKIHFCALKKSYWAGTVPWLTGIQKGNKMISGLNSIEIAEHDTCFGTAYVGHELRINDEIIGFVRMGAGIMLDSHAIEFLNSLFNCLAESGILKRKVKEYAWQ